jgi:membrane-associated phospholipid phosphatase
VLRDSSSTRAVAARSCLLALGWIGITATLFGTGEFVVHAHAITDFDRHVTSWVVDRRTPTLDTTMKVLTWIGSWVSVAVTGGVVLALALTKRLAPATLAVFAAAWAGEYAAVNLVKHAVGRPRPPEVLWLVTVHGASFPSGHAANATLVGVAATAVAFLVSRRRGVRAVTAGVACLAIAVVGFSRVELGVHWTSDVLAGVLVALVWLAAIAGLFATLVAPGAPGSGRDGRGSTAPSGASPGIRTRS